MSKDKPSHVFSFRVFFLLDRLDECQNFALNQLIEFRDYKTVVRTLLLWEASLRSFSYTYCQVVAWLIVNTHTVVQFDHSDRERVIFRRSS